MIPGLTADYQDVAIKTFPIITQTDAKTIIEYTTADTAANMLLQAVDKEIAVDTRDRVTAGSVSRGYRKSMTMVATAYTHTGNPTFTGVMPQRGTIAVDPNVIALGQEVYVEGYGYAIAQDTGGAIRGNKIDVFKDTREEAINWGRRTVKVYILE